MAERQYTPGLLDRLRGRDPNNPNAPNAPSKPPVTTPSVAGASLRNAQAQVKAAGATPAVSPTKTKPVTGGRGGGSAMTRGSAPKVTSAPGRSAAGKNFDQSFAAARKAGLNEFTWNGKKYTTKVK